MSGYTTRDVAALLGLAPRRIRAFARAGLLDAVKDQRGAYHYSFQDLVLLRTARGLADARVPDRRIRRALQRLKARLPRGRSLSEVRITAEGDEVVVHEHGTAWAPESGQLLLDFSVADLAGAVAPITRQPTPRRAHAGADSDGRAGRAEDSDADDWYDLGLDLEAYDVDQAASAYERALLLQDSHADAHVNLGRLLHERGRFEAAERHYRRATEVDAGHATGWFNLGVVLQDAGRDDDAIAAYERAIAIQPDLADAHYNVAGLYERRDDRAAALRHFQAYRRLTG